MPLLLELTLAMLKKLFFMLSLAGLLFISEQQLAAQAENQASLGLAPTGLRGFIGTHRPRLARWTPRQYRSGRSDAEILQLSVRQYLK